MMRRLRRGEDRPEVTLENYAAAYRFFGASRRRDAVAHPLLRLVSLIWAPRLEIDDDVLAEVRDLHSAGTGMVVAANHPSGHDALVLASVVWDRRVRFLSSGTGLARTPCSPAPRDRCSSTRAPSRCSVPRTTRRCRPRYTSRRRAG